MCECVCVCVWERESVREKKMRIYRWCNWKQESWLLMWYRSSLLHSSISTRGQSQYVTHRCRTYKTHSPHWSTLHLIYTSGIISFEQWPDQMRDWVLSVSFALVSCSQTFRLTAEGLGTLAALNGQGPPKRPYDWQVKQPITFRFVPRHVSGRGNVATITVLLLCKTQYCVKCVKLSDIF